MVDNRYILEVLLTEELETVVFDPVRLVDLISVDGAKQSPSVPISLSELRFIVLKGLLSVMAGTAGIDQQIALLERGVTAINDGFASLIGIAVAAGVRSCQCH